MENKADTLCSGTRNVVYGESAEGRPVPRLLARRVRKALKGKAMLRGKTRKSSQVIGGTGETLSELPEECAGREDARRRGLAGGTRRECSATITTNDNTHLVASQLNNDMVIYSNTARRLGENPHPLNPKGAAPR